MCSDTLRSIRKQAKLSQEQLAEKLHVSRQAVTKWETGNGVPDIENLKALSALFNISIDALLGNEMAGDRTREYLYTSKTEYDIDCQKHYDITLPGAKQVLLAGYEGEKIQIRLASDGIPDIQSAFKTKIDDQIRKIDIDVRRIGHMTESRAKDLLFVFIRFPLKYVNAIELSGNTETLELKGMEAVSIEFSGNVSRIMMNDISGHVELNCNQDMDIYCNTLNGRLDVNQISATSTIRLPAGVSFRAETRGIGNTILYEKDGKAADDFSIKDDTAKGCDNVIELNGMKSELIIDSVITMKEVL